MSNTQQFHPRWASAPGDTIADLLEERDVSLDDFAHRMDCSLPAVQDLIHGQSPITIAIARQLTLVLGASVEFWMSRDFQFREDTARIDSEWLAELPLSDMLTFGWLLHEPNPSDQLAACLRFFNVSSIHAWNHTYAALQEKVAFRTSMAFKSRPAAVAAWLRQGAIQAETIHCKPWDGTHFKKCLLIARSLTRAKDPKAFLPVLERSCAESGVALVIVRSPAGCRASGATTFLSREKALLLLSFRYLTDDQFWFSFFHEAGHLLLHGDQGLFLESDAAPTTPREREASGFAEDILIPPEFQEILRHLRPDAREVIRFARRAGVSPGIVVGQLQHSKRFKHNQLNSLKRRFRWMD